MEKRERGSKEGVREEEGGGREGGGRRRKRGMSESGKEREGEGERALHNTYSRLHHTHHLHMYVPALWSQPVSQCVHQRRVGRPPIAPCDGLEGSSGQRWTLGSLALHLSSASEGAEGGGRVREGERERGRRREREGEREKGREGEGEGEREREGVKEGTERKKHINICTPPLTHTPTHPRPHSPTPDTPTHSPTPPLTHT